MPARQPSIVLVTNDPSISRAVECAAPADFTDCRPTLSGGLRAITPATNVLVVDASSGDPLERLLPTLFLNQRGDRRAVVLRREGWTTSTFDPRVATLDWPASPEALEVAISGDEAACDAA